MKFEPNPELDETRKRFKDEYDATFIKRRFMKKDSDEYAVLTKRLRFMEHRTSIFINKNSLYFSRQRHFLFDRMEKRGVFGDKPLTDRHVETLDRCRVGIMPKKIKKMKYCVECQKQFVWYEAAPSEMCRACNSIRPERMTAEAGREMLAGKRRAV